MRLLGSVRCPGLPLLLFACLLLLCSPSPFIRFVNGQANRTDECPSRVRKAWDAMTAPEQSLYVEAIGEGMRRGYHILFTELASEVTSAIEFYRTCGFLYWNRRFILAYENMLRSLGPEFACVTIPYWDFFADYARSLEGECVDGGSTLEACAPILRGLGGSQGIHRDVIINGKIISGNCVATAPVDAFCESSSITNSSECAGCIPREDWSSTPFPSGFGYAGLGVTLGEAKGFRDVTYGIQYGTHNSIHNALSSTIATLMSPADPLFFSIHATVDMLHQMYLECQLGDDVTPTDENLSRFAFQKCSYRYEICPSPTSDVTQLWQLSAAYSNHSAPIKAEEHPVLGQFFEGIPRQFWEFVNVNALGPFSYNYQRDKLMDNLQRNGFVCPRRHQPTPPPVVANAHNFTASNTAIMNFTAVDNTSTSSSSVNVTRELRSRWREHSSREEPEAGDGYDGFEVKQEERDFVQQQSIELLDAALSEAIRVDGTLDTAFSQAELMECQYHEEIVGHVEDYSDLFRESYGLGPDDHPRCWLLKQRMESGEISIKVDNWRGIMRSHYRGNNGRHHRNRRYSNRNTHH